ncbi:MAG: hypothetical protein LC650_02830 [Actinobacteria bacterium]|nr:hypothetical protein [Actinomycetota bacterium]
MSTQALVKRNSDQTAILNPNPVRRRARTLTAEERAQRQKFMESFLESAKETRGVAEASRMMGGDTIVLPMMVFGTRKTDKGRMITGMIAPLAYFKKQGVKGYVYNETRRRNEIEVIQDIRSGDKRNFDDKTKVDVESYDIHNMEEIEGAYDTEEKFCRARRIIGEGDIVTVFFDKSEEDESNIGPGYLVLVNYCISCYHRATKNEAGVILHKQISVFENIESVRQGIYVPVSVIADWLQSSNLVTQQFATRVGELSHYIENTPGVSIDKIKARSYKLPNYFLIPLGWPTDETHPNIGRANSNILVNTTIAKEDNFLRDDKKSKEKTPPKLPKMSLTFKGYQWRGERTSAGGYQPEDVVFAIDMTVFDRALTVFGIRSPEAWGALIPPVFDLMEGVIVAKENLMSGVRVEGNSSRLAELGVGASAEEMNAKLNSPVGKNEPSFVLKLNSEALIVDPVRFVKRVAFRVTANRLIEYWGGKKMARKEDYVTKNGEVAYGSPLMCLSESYGKSLDMLFAQPDHYEFRLMTNVVPTQDTLEDTSKEEVYETLADMPADYGDQFLDFIIKGLGSNRAKNYIKSAGKKLAKDHPCRTYRFQFYGAKSAVIYVFAVNTLQVASQYKSAEEQLASGGLLELIEGGSGNDNMDVDSRSPKKRSINEAQEGDASDDSASSTKRQRPSRHSTAAAPADSLPSNPDELNIDDSEDDEGDEDEEEEDVAEEIAAEDQSGEDSDEGEFE